MWPPNGILPMCSEPRRETITGRTGQFFNIDSPWNLQVCALGETQGSGMRCKAVIAGPLCSLNLWLQLGPSQFWYFQGIMVIGEQMWADMSMMTLVSFPSIRTWSLDTAAHWTTFDPIQRNDIFSFHIKLSNMRNMWAYLGWSLGTICTIQAKLVALFLD